MNVIPICKRNILVDYYSKYFPIILLNEWTELDINTIDVKYQTIQINHKLLTLDYINNILNSLIF